MTTLRVLALSTMLLVAAAATCLATFAQAPTASPAPALPSCAASALALHERETNRSGSDASIVLALINNGEACEIGRIPNVFAFDAAGHELALVQKPGRIGVMRFVAKPLKLEHGTGATFTVGLSQAGAACVRVAKLAIAAGGGNVSAAVDRTACTNPDGSNATISFMSPDTGR